MKIFITLLALTCLSQAASADDLVTPTPTPAIYLPRAGHPNSLRRQEKLERRNERQTAFESKKEVRAQKRVDRVTTATAEARARNAARARATAEREVAAQSRAQSATQKPHLTSDLMTRMGFKEEEIAAQKAREQAAKAGSQDTTAAKTAPKLP